MVDVMPTSSGKVKWDNITYQSYPNTTSYFGNVSANLKATPEVGYNFAYWEIKNANLGNDTLLSLINYPISTSDTIIAHFAPDIVHQLTIIAQPNIGGTVSINGSTPPSLPITNIYPDNTTINLGALPATGFYFKHYLVNNHLLLPNDSAFNVNFNISATDTIIAVFAEIPVYQITLGILPLDGGKLFANTTEVLPNPRTTNQNLNDPFDLSAVANFGYRFVKYSTKHHSLNPSIETEDINFTVNSNDTIIAIFEPIQKIKLTVIVSPEQSGEVEFNFLDITNFPYQDSVYLNTTLSLEAKPYEQFSFSHWKMKHHFMVPDSVSEQVTCSVLEMDTIIANFKLNEIEIPTIYIPLSFTPNGDGLNDFLSLRHSESIASGSIRIFDRWGGLLFSNENINFKWDGTKNGINLPQAVYYYEVNYTKTDGESNIIRGTVAILY
jgi:gliding motility-associated-like protein